MTVMVRRASPSAATMLSNERAPIRRKRLFGLGKGRFDRVQIRRVGRQEDQMASGRRDERSGGGALVHAEVVQHHDLTGAQGGDQHPLHKGLEDQPIDRAADQQALAQPGRRQRRQPGDGLPASARDPPCARWPRAARARTGVRVVGVLVSSRKTSLAGSTPAIAARHAARTASSRSTAIRLFF